MRGDMKKKLLLTLLIIMLIMTDSFLIHYLPKKAGDYPAYDTECMEKVLANQQVTAEQIAELYKIEAKSDYDFAELLFAYYYSNSMEQSILEKAYTRLLKRYPSEVKRQAAYLSAVWSDVVYFPVAKPSGGVASDYSDETIAGNSGNKDIAYEDSWMQSRTYGGDRGHEGCDIMASKNQRGIYPIVSVSDGVVEKMGWLPQGGYRLGIRSGHGAYFYYAHLSDYAEGISVGDTVSAGELLAFMGDTGYSSVEGTTGNFAVHLHFGIYLDDENGQEFAVNSYSVLKYLEDRRLSYNY